AAGRARAPQPAPPAAAADRLADEMVRALTAPRALARAG
ncbi:MAG: hypothetical protein JWM27_4354, partial [Gemmatimonadetes bacterium]|nr:hypothetical protein [Gemmatimonadota bacterium]